MLFDMEMETIKTRDEVEEVFDDISTNVFELVQNEDSKKFEIHESDKQRNRAFQGEKIKIETINEIKEASDEDLTETIKVRDEIKEVLSTNAFEIVLTEDAKKFEIRESDKQKNRSIQGEKIKTINEIKEAFEEHLTENIKGRGEIMEVLEDISTNNAFELVLTDDLKKSEIRESDKQRNRGNQDEENKETFLMFNMELDSDEGVDTITKQRVEENEDSGSEMEDIETNDTFCEDSHTSHSSFKRHFRSRDILKTKGHPLTSNHISPICYQDLRNTKSHLFRTTGL